MACLREIFGVCDVGLGRSVRIGFVHERSEDGVRQGVAEGVGFEPTVPVKGRQFSRLEQSTALPPFRQGAHATKNEPSGPIEPSRAPVWRPDARPEISVGRNDARGMLSGQTAGHSPV